MTTCELCTTTFPQYFVDEGKNQRRARARAEEEAREAANRLQRQTAEFERHHGRYPVTAMDFAIINLNSMLEVEAEAAAPARARATTTTRSGDGAGDNGDEDVSGSSSRGGGGGNVQVVVIDSMGRAQTLRPRNINQLDEMMMMAHERDVVVHAAHIRAAAAVGANNLIDGGGGGLIIGPPSHGAHPFYTEEESRLQTDVERVYSSTQFRFWMKVVVTMLCSFLVLYAIVAMVGGDDDSSHSSPIFVFRVLGFTLPLVLVGRAVWLFRTRRQMLVNQMNEIIEYHHHGGGGGGGGGPRRSAARMGHLYPAAHAPARHQRRFSFPR